MLDSMGNLLDSRYLFHDYSTFSAPRFVHYHLELKDFKELRLDVYSGLRTRISIAVKDTLGNSYVAVRDLEGQKVNTLVLHPDDFKALPEEQFILKPLNAEKVTDSIEIFDTGTADALIPHNNRIVIHRLISILPELPEYTGILRIAGNLEIHTPWKINGDVIIEDGASLKVQGTHIQISGRILNFGGALEVDDSELRFVQGRSRGQVIHVTRSGSVIIRHSRVISINASGIYAGRDSSVFLDGFEGLGLLRHEVENGSFFYAKNSNNIGELRYGPGSEIRIENSRNVWIWLYAGENLRGDMYLPVRSRIGDWSGDSFFPVRIVDCDGVKWGLQIHPGVGGSIQTGRFSGVEVVVPEGYEADFSGIRNNKLPPGRMLQPAFYQLRFNREVEAGIWNFVVENGSSLVLRNSDLNSVTASGNNTSLTIMQSEINGPDGTLLVELGSNAFVQDSTIRGPLSVYTGGNLRGFYSSFLGSCIIGNGGILTVRQVESAEVPEIAVGGTMNGKTESPGGEDDSGSIRSLPVPLLSRMEVGGIGDFLPEISGFEELENAIIPHFEIGILNRFFVRFPEFEYVVFRRGMPWYANVSLKTAALFSHRTEISSAEESAGPVEGGGSAENIKDYRTPLSFESILAGRLRTGGASWVSAEIGTDFSGQSYKGLRIYTEMEYLRVIPFKNLSARLYTGFQFGDEGYLSAYHPGTGNINGLLDLEKIAYGVRINKSVSSLWTLNISCSVDNYVGSTAAIVSESQDPFDWSVILALIYHIR